MGDSAQRAADGARAAPTAHTVPVKRARLHVVEHRLAIARPGGVAGAGSAAGSDDAAPVLVLVHGWPQHGGAWDGVLDALASGRTLAGATAGERAGVGAAATEVRVLVPDLRGMGGSVPASWRDMRPARLGADVRAVVTALTSPDDAVWVVGHDWGGVAVGHAVLRRRCVWGRRCRQAWTVRVRGALLFAAVPPVYRPRMLARLAPRLRYMLAIALPSRRHDRSSAGLRSGAFVRLLLRAGSPTHAWTDEELDRYARPLQDARRARASVWLYRWFVLGGACGGALRGIVRGTRGPITAVDTVAVLCDGDPVMEAAVFAQRPGSRVRLERMDGGHFVIDEAPVAVAERLRRWMLADG